MLKSDHSVPTHCRLLCVDDEPLMREVLELLLHRKGYDVRTCADGHAALRLLERDPTAFDVIITDNQMPGLTGIEMVELLRANGYNGRVIFYSSSIAGDRTALRENLRIDAIITKGGPVSDLLAALETVARRG